MTTIDLKYLLAIGLPLLILLCVIIFMIGRQSGKKYVYRMMNGGQLYGREPPEDPVAAAMRIVREEDLLKSKQYDEVKPRFAIQGETDPNRRHNQGGWLWWMGGTEGARG